MAKSPIHRHSANEALRGEKEKPEKEGHGGENMKGEVKKADESAEHEGGGPKDIHERHKTERHEMHARHESESKDHHTNHMVATRKMHARHDQEHQELNARQMAEMGGEGGEMDPAAAPGAAAAPAAAPAMPAAAPAAAA